MTYELKLQIYLQKQDHPPIDGFTIYIYIRFACKISVSNKSWFFRKRENDNCEDLGGKKILRKTTT